MNDGHEEAYQMATSEPTEYGGYFLRTVQRIQRTMGLPRPIRTLVPDIARTTLSYRAHFSKAPAAAGAASLFQFNTNSLYDPNYTGTGHQPYTYDQWAALFTHYAVIKSKITVRFHPSLIPTESVQKRPTHWICTTQYSENVPATLAQVRDYPWVQTKDGAGPNQDYDTHLTTHWNIFGEQYFTDDDYMGVVRSPFAAAIGFNPLYMGKFNFGTYNGFGVQANTVYHTVEVFFDVIFFTQVAQPVS